MDAASFKRVYDSFQECHALFAASFGRKQWREHSRNYLQCWCRARSGATPRTSPNRWACRPGRCSAFSLRPAGTTTLSSGGCRNTWPPSWDTVTRCGCSTAATSPSKGGNRREWPGSIAAGWARWPTARPGCSWPASAHWAGRWWTNGCICRRAGPRTMAGARRQGCRRRGGTTGQRRSWPWRCWGGPWNEAI